MGTRSVVAQPQGDGWEGRYVHWDGYPLGGVGEAMFKAHEVLGGPAEMRRVLIDNEPAGWSILASKRVDFTMPPCWYDGDFPDRHGPVSYTARGEEGGDLIRHDSEDCGCEWAYVIGDQCLSVFERAHDDDSHMTGMFGIGSDQATWRLRGTIRWESATIQDELGIIECGRNYERCSHYAWHHFPEAGGTSYSTAVWLGLEPPGYRDVTHVLKGGVKYRLTGSGHWLVKGNGDRTHQWFSSVESPGGCQSEMFTHSHPKRGPAKPARGVTWLFEGLPARSN